jgi:UTP--glucose-1-phosphate uridylyltransferase
VIREVLPRHVRAVFVTQAEALGLGHAVLCARPVIGDQPFAVLLPDDLIWNGRSGTGGPGALKQMVDLAGRENASVIAVQDVPREHTGSYGIVATENISGRQGLISAIVEKPKPEVAPSTLGVVGRYVLSGRIFEILEKTRPGAGGEIQLTDGIAALLKEERVLAYRFEGRRFDCGSRIGLVEATIQYALDHDDLADAARAYMRDALSR